MTLAAADRIVPSAEQELRGVDYDALLVMSFGGPETMDDVLPFLNNVLRGRNVPPERIQKVAAHYELFGGGSPINDQNRALIREIERDFAANGVDLPVYWGNRNWHPMTAATIARMVDDGVRRALVLVTSAYGSYPGCRQYLEDIDAARAPLGERAPDIHKLRAYFNHPGFIAANVDHLRLALGEVPDNRRPSARLVFTAHSIPVSMLAGSPYREQLTETARLVAEGAGVAKWDLVYQSRSGRPGQPWLEPDIGTHLGQLARDGVSDVIVAPIGFVSDHMEVLYDLDTEAKGRAGELGLNLVRASTAGTHPRFVRMVRDLVLERMTNDAGRHYVGELPPADDFCAAGCCPAPRKGR